MSLGFEELIKAFGGNVISVSPCKGWPRIKVEVLHGLRIVTEDAAEITGSLSEAIG